MNLADYVECDATGLAQLIAARQVSAAEVQRAARQAIEQVNPELNALVGDLFDEPLGYTADGPFLGVPFAIKDLALHAQGVPTRMGSRLSGPGVPFPHDTELMARFKRAGLATLGRTATPEFGFNASTESVANGPTHNPWDTARTPGGSSGGSAALVAARALPVAHASDGGGSIRVPASWCGLVGLKPTRGRTPVGPDTDEPLSGLGIEFALTRTVRDAAALLDAVQGAGVGDKYEIAPPVRPYARELSAPPGRLRIAVTTQSWSGSLVDPEHVQAALAVSRELASLGHTVEEASPSVEWEPSEWIRGRGWDQNLWTPKDFPTKTVLDRVAPDRPVVLRRIDGHSTWVNTEALRRAGISRDTKDPTGGRILRDSKGEPTGVLVDNAEELVVRKIPPESAEARERMILAAADKAVGAGLTGVHEMGIDDETIAVYRKLAAEGRLKLRVYAFLTGEGQIASLSRRKPDVDEEGTAAFTLRAVKLYADGSLGSRSAALLAPYADEPGNSGLLLTTPEALAEAVLAASASGFQLGIHAIGDRANRMVLDAYAKVAGKDQRHRIEHAQIVAPEDIRRFAALGVMAAMQPTHATSDMPWAEARLGKDRLAGAYAWKSIVAAGAHVVGGSDFPIEEVSPLLALDAALTRQDEQGSPPGGWLPQERLTLEEALRIYTVEPAWSSFQERNHGRIARGMVADLTVFDGELSAGRLLSRKVDWTILGGQIVYARAGAADGT